MEKKREKTFTTNGEYFMKLSIIVPVYNIAHYLNDCVQSVLAQSFQDWELVLVNDGSTDQSPMLCEEWAKKDMRIRVVHKTNGGLSDARNAGLLEAKGEYIHFLDGDDYYTSDEVVQTLMEQVEKYQYPDTLLFCRIDRYEDTGREKLERPYDTDFINHASSTTIIFEHLLRTQRFNMSACLQLLRRDCLLENQVFFEKGLLSEDVDWSIALWQCIQTVKAVNYYGYCYRHRSGSITMTLSIRTYKSYQYMFKKWQAKLCSQKREIDVLQLKYLAYLYPTLVYNYFNVRPKERKDVLTILTELQSVLVYSKTSKSDRIKRMIEYCGLKLTCYIMSGYVQLKRKGYLDMLMK